MGWIDSLRAIPGKVSRWFGGILDSAKRFRTGIGAKLSGLRDGITSGLRGSREQRDRPAQQGHQRPQLR